MGTKIIVKLKIAVDGIWVLLSFTENSCVGSVIASICYLVYCCLSGFKFCDKMFVSCKSKYEHAINGKTLPKDKHSSRFVRTSRDPYFRKIKKTVL
jgi:hypothetical protein